VSHEEPDIAVPEAKLAKDNLAAMEPVIAPHAPPAELQGRIDARTIIAGVLVAVIMGASYPYMVLKLGFGPNVSVVAAFFGFLFLNMFDAAGFVRARARKVT